MDVQVTTPLLVQAIITFITPFGLQLAKRAKSPAWSWFDHNRPKFSIFVSMAIACLTNLGVQHASSASAAIHWGPTPTALQNALTFFCMVLGQFGGHHILYEGLWRKVVPAAPLIQPTRDLVEQRYPSPPQGAANMVSGVPIRK